MRVVILDTTLDTDLFGGAQTFLHKISKGLVDAGVEVHLVSIGEPRSLTAKGIENCGAFFHNNIWSKKSLNTDSAKQLAKWINNLAADVYVISVSQDVGWLVLPYLEPGIATISIGHNDSTTFYEPARHYQEFLTVAVGVSEEICTKYINYSRLLLQNTSWIPYGVESFDGELKKNTEKPLSIVYVGRLEEDQKRSKDLVKIAKGLTNQGIKYRLTIMGDGPSKNYIEDQLSDEVRREIVLLTGWVTSKQLLEELRNADIFLLTSAYEGFCISLIEAMANGCCPIVTNIESGNKRLVSDNYSGFIVPIGGIQEFVSRVELLNFDRKKLYQMRIAAFEEGKKYSIDTMVKKYIDFFEIAIEKAKKSPRRYLPDFPVMESCRSPYPAWLRRIKHRFTAK